MTNMFQDIFLLSDTNKGLIHQSFSSNSNWSYDWREFVVLDDTNFQIAVNLWFDNQADANATYGHISDWNTSAVTDMSNAFRDRTTFNEDIGNWDVSNVTNMADLFKGASSFNQDIGDWDVSSVRSMPKMFQEASSFNQPIGGWNVSSVENMNHILTKANSFNQSLADWNVSSNKYFFASFNNTAALSSLNKGLIHQSFASNSYWPYDWREFVVLDNSNFQTAVNLWFDNQADANATYGHISDWNTSAVTDMSNAFKDRTSFNEDIGDWDVSNVTTFFNLFTNAISFNQDISDWNTSSLENMSRCFYGASSFNSDLSKWDISNVNMMTATFRNATSFNQNINSWDVSNVLNIENLFYGASVFNQPIGDWNTSSVTNMISVFNNASAFNQPIGNWDTSSVTKMNRMFRDASDFNQDISDWDIYSVYNMYYMFDGANNLSNRNKSKIHSSFSANSNWSYDWSNFAPEDLQAVTNLEIVENKPAGSFVGEFNASDPDDDQLNYQVVQQLGSGQFAPFYITQDGVLRTTRALDFEEAESYELTIRAMDPDGEMMQKVFIVNVQDVFVPIVETGAANNQINGMLRLEGSIIDRGGDFLTMERGFLISRSPILSIDDPKVMRMGAGSGLLNQFNSVIQSDPNGGKYFYIAYAENNEGIGLGLEEVFELDKTNSGSDWFDGSPIENTPNWWKSSWFGTYYKSKDSGWIMHEKLGWIYPSPGSENGVWIWKDQLGWLWTDADRYPFLHSYRYDSWLYFYGKHSRQSLFYLYADSRWLVIDQEQRGNENIEPDETNSSTGEQP